MAITDVLRGLLGGAGGALAGYNLQQQREQERLEREAERLERQEATKRQQEQADRLFNMQVQQAVAEGILSPTEYVEYAKPSDFLRGEAIGMQRPAAGADMSSILADQPIGMQRQASSRRSEIASALSPETRGGRMAGGAMVAPGQTYPAIDRVLAEAEPTPRAEDIGARDTERPARGLDRVLEITPEDIAGRFERAPMQGSWTEGRGTFEGLDGQMYRAVTPEERARAGREGVEELFVRGLSGDQNALAEISSRDLGADFRTFVKMVQPDVEEPDLVSTSEGLLRWDPETGKYVPEIGPSGRPLMAPQPSPPSPARPLSIQGEDGIEYLVDPITGEGRPVTIGGQPLVGRRSSNFFSPFFPSGSGGEQMNGFNMPPIDSLESSYQQYRQQSPQQTGGSDGLTEEEASVENAVAEIRRNPNRAEAVIERFKNAPNLRDAIRRRVFGPSVTTQSVPVRG